MFYARMRIPAAAADFTACKFADYRVVTTHNSAGRKGAGSLYVTILKLNDWFRVPYPPTIKGIDKYISV